MEQLAQDLHSALTHFAIYVGAAYIFHTIAVFAEGKQLEFEWKDITPMAAAACWLTTVFF